MAMDYYLICIAIEVSTGAKFWFYLARMTKISILRGGDLMSMFKFDLAASKAALWLVAT